jgi:hypothetical protein
MSKLVGFWKLPGAVEILDFDIFGSLKSLGDGYHVSYACTLKTTSRTLAQGSHELWHGRLH